MYLRVQGSSLRRVFSKRELTCDDSMASNFTSLLLLTRSLYAIAVPSVVCISVTFVQPTQPVEIFRNFSSPFGSLAIQ